MLLLLPLSFETQDSWTSSPYIWAARKRKMQSKMDLDI